MYRIYLLIRIRLRFSISKCHKYTTNTHIHSPSRSYWELHPSGWIICFFLFRMLRSCPGAAVMTAEGSLFCPHCHPTTCSIPGHRSCGSCGGAGKNYGLFMWAPDWGSWSSLVISHHERAVKCTGNRKGALNL